MKFNIVHPSRGRPEKSFATMQKWAGFRSKNHDLKIIVSMDNDDEKRDRYVRLYWDSEIVKLTSDWNKSSVEAINRATDFIDGDIIMVVSDDTDCFNNWDEAIVDQVKGKQDWILKTKDGIQDWIITMPIMDRAYYNRFGYIYHPGFSHLFCDTYMTCVADINQRKITSSLLFPHNHYSKGGSQPDEVHKKNDATWRQGEEKFIELMKQFSPEERNLISDPAMKNWLRNKGVRS